MNVRIGGNAFSSQRSCKKCGGRMEQKGRDYKCKKCGFVEVDEETNFEKNIFRGMFRSGGYWW